MEETRRYHSVVYGNDLGDTMTVAELIEELKKHDPKASVMLHHSLLMDDYIADFSDQGGTSQTVDRIVNCAPTDRHHPEVFILSRLQK